MDEKQILSSIQEEEQRQNMKLKENEKYENLKTYNGQDQVYDSYTLKEKLNAEETEREYVEFNGMPELSKHITGLVKGDLVVVSGPTGSGKTTLCRSLTYHWANSKQDPIFPLWFTYEESPEEMLLEYGDNLPLFFLPDEHTAYNVDWLEERVMEYIAKYKDQIGNKTPLIFIDHLHYLVGFNDRANMSNTIGAICRKLKTIARKHKIIIFLIAHIKKVKIERDKAPDLTDIRDSSFITQEASFVLMVWKLMERENDQGNPVYGNKGMVAVQKKRRRGNKLGYIKYSVGEDGLIREVDQIHQPDGNIMELNYDNRKSTERRDMGGSISGVGQRF